VNGLLVGALVFAGVAALIHIAIFGMESITWSQPRTWRRFGLASQADADTVRPMAFNQGFYNLFLAIATVAGGSLLPAPGLQQAGAAILVVSLASMVLAATVLLVSSPSLARAAAIQGLAPAIGLALLVLGLATA
jgi:putative membrane protein